MTDWATGERGRAFNEGTIVGLKDSAKQPVEQIEFSIELGGTRHRAVRLISAGSLQWVLVALDRAEGMRQIMCREVLRPESRCQPWIEAAARWDWRAGPPPSVPRDLRLPEVAGRPYKIPQACGHTETPSGWVVTCSDKTMFGWSESSVAGTLNPEAVIASFRKLAKKEGTIDCSVEGVPTQCWNGTAPDDGMAVYVSHPAVVRGKWVVVLCLQGAAGVVSHGLPQACESVLALPRP